MTTASTHRPATLEAQARTVLADLRGAIAQVLAALQPPARRPRDLVEHLGLHQTLAWRVIRIAHSSDLLADAQHIPGPSSFTTFLRAAGRAGVSADLTDRSRLAFERFRALVDAQAGDRPSLSLMLNGLIEGEEGGEATARESRAIRRAGFRCATSTWGVQARTRILSTIARPSVAPGKIDFTLIRGAIGMRRVRPGAVLPIAPMVVKDDDGSLQRELPSRALDPTGIHKDLPLIRRFCTCPLPEIRVGRTPRGTPEYQLGELPIGGKEGVTFYFGERHHTADYGHPDQSGSYSNTALTIHMPTETAVVDVWTHRDLYPGARPRGRLIGELFGTPWFDQHPDFAERLVLPEQPETIGAGLRSAHVVDAPEYADVIAYAFDQLEWNDEDFTLHRLRLEFPVIATALVLQMVRPDAEP